MNTERSGCSLLIHAPNVHTGGGMVLLQELLSVPDLPMRFAQFDERAEQGLGLPDGAPARFVRRSLASRLHAEWRLWRTAGADDLVLCFHGLPPLFPVAGRVVVFVQNRILFEHGSTWGYRPGTRARLVIERLWVRALHRKRFNYVVQTPSMASLVRRCLGATVDLCVVPFAPSMGAPEPLPRGKDVAAPRYDFVYVASGEAHKNHRNLLKAWRYLAAHGRRPSLALTVDERSYPALAEDIALFTKEHALDILNLGHIPATEVSRLYMASRALLYPSRRESFGLPLVEATRFGLPVLAPELDYVRDVVRPRETFDPESPVSIARAVQRFMDDAAPVVQVRSAEQFVAEVLACEY